MNKRDITDIATQMVEENGLINLSRDSLCERAGISDGSFTSIMGENFTSFVGSLKRKKITGGTHHNVVKSRTDPALRMRHILKCAVDVAIEKGYKHVTRADVANAAGVSEGLVSRYFSTMERLRRDIVRHAIKEEIHDIILQAMIAKDKHLKRASKELKEAALTSLEK